MTEKKTISIDADIIAGRSIGGISLGENALDILEAIGSDFTVEEIRFNNFGHEYFHYKIDNGKLNFTSDSDGNILALWCEPGYRGKYKNYLYPGVTAGELKK